MHIQHHTYPTHLLFYFSYSRPIPSMRHSVFAFGVKSLPSVILSIPTPTTFTNTHTAPYLYPTHPPCLFFYSRLILNASHSIFAFGGEISHPHHSLNPQLHHFSWCIHVTHAHSAHPPSSSTPDYYCVILLIPGSTTFASVYTAPHAHLHATFLLFSTCGQYLVLCSIFDCSQLEPHSHWHSCTALSKLLHIVPIAPQTYPTLLLILICSLDQHIYIVLHSL